MTELGATMRAARLLAAGRVLIMAAAVALAAAAAVHEATAGPPAGAEFRAGPIGTVLFYTGLVALAAGQAVSLHGLRTTARAFRGGGVSSEGLVRAAHRSEWSMALVLFPALVCLLQVLSPPPPSILGPFAVLLLAAPLLDQAQAIWTHRQVGAVPSTGALRPDHRPVPPGSGALIRRRHGAAIGILTVFAGFGAILLVATVVTEAGRIPVAPAAAIAHIAAAAAAVILPVLYIPPVRCLRRAIDGDAVQPPALAHAAARFARVTASAAALAVPVLVAGFLDPAVVHLAAARPAMLAVAIGFAGSPHFAALTYLHFGAPQPSDLRRLQRNGRR